MFLLIFCRRAINKNKLIALMAAVTLRETPGSTVVTDSVTSSGLTKFIEAQGGKHMRCALWLSDVRSSCCILRSNSLRRGAASTCGALCGSTVTGVLLFVGIKLWRRGVASTCGALSLLWG